MVWPPAYSSSLTAVSLRLDSSQNEFYNRFISKGKDINFETCPVAQRAIVSQISNPPSFSLNEAYCIRISTNPRRGEEQLCDSERYPLPAVCKLLSESTAAALDRTNSVPCEQNRGLHGLIHLLCAGMWKSETLVWSVHVHWPQEWSRQHGTMWKVAVFIWWIFHCQVLMSIKTRKLHVV